MLRPRQSAPAADWPLAHALALTEAGRLEDGANIYRSLGPAATWRPAPHVVLRVHTLGIAIARLLNETSDVAVLRNALLPYRGHHIVSGIGALSYFGPVELWLGVAAACLGLLHDAIPDLQQAVDTCRANGVLGFELESMAQLAEALVRRAHPEDVQRGRLLLADAAPRASQLGMRPVAASIERLNKQLMGADSLQLSGRELEVAQLVAEGLTNRQIGGRLIISERTAQDHVQHILTKLGLANRSQIARMFATRK